MEGLGLSADFSEPEWAIDSVRLDSAAEGHAKSCCQSFGFVFFLGFLFLRFRYFKPPEIFSYFLLPPSCYVCDLDMVVPEPESESWQSNCSGCS